MCARVHVCMRACARVCMCVVVVLAAVVVVVVVVLPMKSLILLHFV